MSNILRRLQKLEERSTDGSGLRPDSPEWLDYWARKVSRILTGEEPDEPGCIPLEVWDAIGHPDRSERDEKDVGSGAHDLVAQMAAVRRPGAGTASDNA